MDISSADVAKLAAASSVTDLLTTYKSLPAIFSTWPVPLDCGLPYIITAGNISDTPWDDMDGSVGRDVTRDVWCVASTDAGLVSETLAEAVRAALHNQSLTITGADHVLMTCIGATVAPTDPSLSGRVLTFRIIATEE